MFVTVAALAWLALDMMASRRPAAGRAGEADGHEPGAVSGAADGRGGDGAPTTPAAEGSPAPAGSGGATRAGGPAPSASAPPPARAGADPA
jgi:hypothetical protein